MNDQNGVPVFSNPPPVSFTATGMNFGSYPADWHTQSPSYTSPHCKPQDTRRPSNPITIPKAQFIRKPSVVNPVSPTSPVICLKCGLHSRPSSVDIIEAGGCSPKEVNLQPHFPNPSRTKVSQYQHWPTDQCCEGWCPDTAMPPRRFSSVDNNSGGGSYNSTIDGQRRRHHHRRRSSLCYSRTLIDEDDETKAQTGQDAMTNYKDEAKQIARRVVERHRRQSKTSIGSSVSTASVILED